MRNHLRWAAIGLVVFGVNMGACAQEVNTPKDKDAVAKSLIEMQRQRSEAATPAEEISVVKKIFADDFLWNRYGRDNLHEVGKNREGKS